MFFQNLVHAQRFKYPIATYPLTLGAGIDGITMNADTTESVGSNLVTDSGFDVVTKGSDLFADDFSADNTAAKGTGWSHDAGNSEFDCNGSQSSVSNIRWNDVFAGYETGDAFEVIFEIANYSTGTLTALFSPSGVTGYGPAVYGDGVYTHYINNGGGDPNLIFQANASFVGSLKAVTVKPITFTNWTTTHWHPQAVGGVLTGKAVKFAGTADDLEQDISAVATTVYRDQYTATRTAGTLTPQVGGADGTAITADGTYSDDITATGTGNLKFKADASFAGTIDLSTARAVTNPKQNGITVELHRDSERLVTYKTVAGVSTVLSAITYSATVAPKALHDADGRLVVIYDDAIVYQGDVADASIVNNKRHYVATGEGSGAFSVERLRYGAEIETGTCTISLLYYITATEADHFAAGLVVGDYFISDGTETLDANNKVRRVNP